MLGFGNILTGASASIRDIDFKNFAYPFYADDIVGPPGGLTWLSTVGTKLISLRNGQYRIACGAPVLPPPLDPAIPLPELCPSMIGGGASFGHIDGLPGVSAAVVVTYHSGGTAQWAYIYIVTMRTGKPDVVAWLETGSRADMGLKDISFDHGDLVVAVNDPAKREGDCCSLGTITTRYRWHSGSFQQIGSPVLANVPR
jgi:hypothetical protein